MKTNTADSNVKNEFRTHLIVYISVISLLAAINVFITQGYIWFIWPMLGWGIAIVLHAVSTYRSTSTSEVKKHVVEEQVRK